MGIRWGALSDDYVADWAELTNLLAKVDGTDEFYSAEDLGEELHEPGMDPALDTIAVWSDDKLVGFSQLRVGSGLSDGVARAGVGGGVHPDFRGQGIGREIMNRIETRAAALTAERHPGVEAVIRTSGGIDGDPVRPMLEHRGYEVVRYYHSMKRALPAAELTPPTTPVTPYRDDFLEATRIAHNDAFSTHWGSAPQDEAEWRDSMTSRTFRPAASFLALAEDGSVDAYVLSNQWVNDELYVGVVGTRQAARGRGLARACLTATLIAAGEQGYREISLDVDSANAQGAGRLYASVGFEIDKTFFSCQKGIARD
jgi:ribosomal protein S18 acetylase RimI-like enzyme